MLTITVLHYQNNELTDNCLWWIDRQTLPSNTRKLVIDNGSFIPYKQKYEDNWEVIRLPENRGNIGGQNACFEHSEDGWVLFVANDIRIKSDGAILSLYAKALRSAEYCGQIQPELVKPGLRITRNVGKILTSFQSYKDNSGLKIVWPGYGISYKGRYQLINAVTSSCYIMRKKVWADIGGFDEALPGAYEDVDMGIRLRKARYRIWHDPNNWVEHLGNATLKYSKEDRWRFHQARKMVIQKHYNGFDRWLRLKACDFIHAIQP